MILEPAKRAENSQTYSSAGWAKKLSFVIAVLNSLSAATFLGSPLLHQFVSEDIATQIQALSALGTVLLSSVAAHRCDRAQQGRLNARGLVYTKKGRLGLSPNAPTVVIPTTKTEESRLIDVMPYIEGYESIDSVYTEISRSRAA